MAPNQRGPRNNNNNPNNNNNNNGQNNRRNRGGNGNNNQNNRNRNQNGNRNRNGNRNGRSDGNNNRGNGWVLTDQNGNVIANDNSNGKNNRNRRNNNNNSNHNNNSQWEPSLHDMVRNHIQIHPNYQPPQSPGDPSFEAPVPPFSDFPFQRDWNQDATINSIADEFFKRCSYASALLDFTAEQRYGALRFLFTLPEQPVLMSRYTRNGAFVIANALDNMAHGEDQIKREIARVFYTFNEFLFNAPDELHDFVSNTPPRSLALVRNIVFGSNVVRRPRGARGRAGRTREDLVVEADLRKMRNLDNIAVFLGYDIDDEAHRLVMTIDWSMKHPNYPRIHEYRREDHTIQGYVATSHEWTESQDRDVFGFHKQEIERLKLTKEDVMDTTDG